MATQKERQYASLSLREVVERHTHRENVDYVLDELRSGIKELDKAIDEQNFYRVSGAREKINNARDILKTYEDTLLKGQK